MLYYLRAEIVEGINLRRPAVGEQIMEDDDLPSLDTLPSLVPAAKPAAKTSKKQQKPPPMLCFKEEEESSLEEEEEEKEFGHTPPDYAKNVYNKKGNGLNLYIESEKLPNYSFACCENKSKSKNMHEGKSASQKSRKEKSEELHPEDSPKGRNVTLPSHTTLSSRLEYDTDESEEPFTASSNVKVLDNDFDLEEPFTASSTRDEIGFVPRIEHIDALNAYTEHFFLEMRDGVRVKVSKIQLIPDKQPEQVMLFCLPLGADGLFTNMPIIEKYSQKYTLLTWCYRGLFESEMPDSNRSMSIRDHAEDAKEVLEKSGYSCAEVIVAHSMGCQVALEALLLYPDMARSIILMNGAAGHVFETAFQPFLRIPFAGAISERLVNTIMNHNPQRFLAFWHKVINTAACETVLRTAGKVVGAATWKRLAGDDYLSKVTQRYLGGVSADDKTARNYCQFFQELHAHSVYHLLHQIEQPVLLLSGRFDYFTPPYRMAEMASCMKNATHHCDNFSTHFSIIEHPEWVLSHIKTFLDSQEERWK